MRWECEEVVVGQTAGPRMRVGNNYSQWPLRQQGSNASKGSSRTIKNSNLPIFNDLQGDEEIAPRP